MEDEATCGEVGGVRVEGAGGELPVVHHGLHLVPACVTTALILHCMAGVQYIVTAGRVCSYQLKSFL